jgi:hypothetical protein
MSPLLLKPRILKDEHAIPFAGQRPHPGDPLPVEGGLIPDHVRQQMIELLLIGLGHDLRQGVAVFVGMLAEQAGEIGVLSPSVKKTSLRHVHVNSASKALASFKSAVSKPSVNQL